MTTDRWMPCSSNLGLSYTKHTSMREHKTNKIRSSIFRRLWFFLGGGGIHHIKNASLHTTLTICMHIIFFLGKVTQHSLTPARRSDRGLCCFWYDTLIIIQNRHSQVYHHLLSLPSLSWSFHTFKTFWAKVRNVPTRVESLIFCFVLPNYRIYDTGRRVNRWFEKS